MSKTIYRDFDLPNKFLDGDQDYIPLKEHDPERIALLRKHPGMKVYYDQLAGTNVAQAILESVEDQADVAFAAETIAICGLTSSWYLFGRNASVQRRRLKLEILATDDPDQRPSALMLMQNAISDLADAVPQTEDVIQLHPLSNKESYKTKQRLGRTLGHASLTLACVPIGDYIGYDSSMLSDFDLQDMARQRGLTMIQKGRLMGKSIGTAPSLAQLAHPDSDVSVYWRRSAPEGAREAAIQAQKSLLA